MNESRTRLPLQARRASAASVAISLAGILVKSKDGEEDVKKKHGDEYYHSGHMIIVCPWEF